MSIDKVHNFLIDTGGNFTEKSPRPPVPGEENELQSNGGTSTKSSSSHKSHLSGKSHTSSRSARSDKSHSPAATPRRSNLDKSVTSLCSTQGVDCGEVDAPLGFEPEGSAANSPPFTENGTPQYLKWAENLKYLLDDGDGVKLFRSFLESENCVYLLDFWFACRGLKMVSPSAESKIYNLVKLIYRKYIRGDQLNLRGDIKEAIARKVVSKDGINQGVFDDAQVEIENLMRRNTYPLFLKSDLYVQYIQTGGESPKTTNSSGANSARPLLGPLPTLHEDSELQPEDCVKVQASAVTPPALSLTARNLMTTRFTRYVQDTSGRVPETNAGLYLQQPSELRPPKSRPVNPYHVNSYTTVSAQDSELQSLSSDALTDDTISQTDSSVTSIPVYNTKKWRKQTRAMHRSAKQNPDTALNQQFIPRTERAPKDRNIAETDPAKFATMLIDKLERVYQDQVKQEKLELSLQSIRQSEESSVDISNLSKCSMLSQAKPSTPSGSLLIFAKPLGEDDNAQSILEEHSSRIWGDSANQTPSRSPGHHSPKSQSPERLRQKLALSTSLSSALPGTLKHPRNKREKDQLSTKSFDSGLSDDKVFFETETHHKHIHHHHHHHHVAKESFRNKQQMEMDAQNRSMTCYRGEPAAAKKPDSLPLAVARDDIRGRSREGKRAMLKKGSDSSSQIDSGVSMVYERSPVPNVPGQANPNNEKVLAWMLENDKLGSSTYSDSDKSSSHKRSSKSVSAVASPALHRPSVSSSKKQPVQYNASRSGSLDRSGSQSWYNEASSHVLPRHPIIQDPSMPLLDPPNPTTQLEEAKRRLMEDESKKLMKSSRSFGSTSSKDKRMGQTPFNISASRAMPPPPPKVVPAVSDAEAEVVAPSGGSASASGTLKSEKRPAKKQTASVPTTPSTPGDVTVVGYYFCGEPIPYRIQVPGKNITLSQFKQLVTKKGTYRYFFKTVSTEFESGVVHEEVTDDSEVLPLWEGKVVGKVEKIE